MICRIVLLFVLASAVMADEQPFYFPFVEQYDRPPYAWRYHCDGQPTGAVRDLLARVFQQANIVTAPIDYRLSTNLSAIMRQDMHTGALDGGVFIKDKHDDLLRYTETPIIAAEASIVYRVDKQPAPVHLASLENLRGAIVGVPDGSSLEDDFIATYKALNPVIIYDVSLALKPLLSGEYDYIIEDSYIINSVLRPHFQAGRLAAVKISSPVFKPMYLALSKKSKYVNKLQVLDQVIGDIRSSGLEALIYKKYMIQWTQQIHCQQHEPL